MISFSLYKNVTTAKILHITAHTCPTYHKISYLIVSSSILYSFITIQVYWDVSSHFPENVPVELREPLYKDQYEQEHLKPSVSKLLLSPETYCRVQALLAQAYEASPSASMRSLADNSALLQFLIKKGCAPKVQDKDVSEEDLSVAPIKTVGVLPERLSCSLSIFTPF